MISKENNEYIMSCNDSSDIGTMKDEILFLSRHVLNKRIIDASGKKLRWINDLEIGILLNFLGKNIPSKLISWEEVEKVDFFRGGVKFSKTYSKLSNLHQSDIKEIIKELDLKMQTIVLR